MISQLASPAVCVIDDEPDDYGPILTALNGMYVSSVHLSGNDLQQLPPQPFRHLQLVFLDLHLTGAIGKDAASHAANVFLRVVPSATAPIVVVIWSKYASDRVSDGETPPEDQETEAELFKRTLFEAEPRFRGRLIFLELAKPKPDDRPDQWPEMLKQQIADALAGASAVDLLWAWSGLVRNACRLVGSNLTDIAEGLAGDSPELTDSQMQAVMRYLTHAQGEGDISAASAPTYLVNVLSSLLIDQLDNDGEIAALNGHGSWLSSEPETAASQSLISRMNGELWTAPVTDGTTPYLPGTVYVATNIRSFCRSFGLKPSELNKAFTSKNLANKAKDKAEQLRAGSRLVAIEISPACDVAQGTRHTAYLVGGVVAPIAVLAELKKQGAWLSFEPFYLRWAHTNFAAQDVAMVFCHRLKAALELRRPVSWLTPWFRLREIETTALRHAHSAQTSRVGYVTLKTGR